MSLNILGANSEFTQEKDRYCKPAYGMYIRIEDAEDACNNDEDCTHVYDKGCNDGKFRLCRRIKSAISISKKGSCLYRKGNNPV